MADFGPSQQEIQNIVDATDNTVSIVDGVNPALKATVNASGELKVIVTGGGSAGQLVQDGQAVVGTDVGRLSVGTDGTNYQVLKTDASGELQIDVLTLPAIPAGTNNIGDVDVLTLPNVTLASQASPFTNDLKITLDGELVDVSDRANRDLGKVDIAGFDVALPTGTNTIGKVNQGLPTTIVDSWPVKITDGITTAEVDSGTNRLKVDTGTTSSNEEATFVAVSLVTAVGNNKSMMSIVNTHATLRVKIKQIIIRNQQTTAVTGIMADFNLRRCTGHSAGTLIVPEVRDTIDSLNAAITVRTGATIAGESASTMDRWKWSSDEHGVGTLDQEGFDKAFMNCFPMTNITDPSEKRITLRQNQGLTLKQVTNSTAGNFDIIIVFTVI
jgi:hypothetical protein